MVGALLAWCQGRLNEAEDRGRIVYAWASAVLAVFLLLFIRGYFTDAIMKLAYLLFFSWLASCLIKHGSWLRSLKRGGGSQEVDAV